MKWLLSLFSAGLCVSLLASAARAEEWHPKTPLPPLPSNSCACPPPRPAPGCPQPYVPGTPGMPGTPGTPGVQPGEMAPPGGEVTSQSPEAGALAAASFDPAIFGDLIGVQGQRILVLPQGVTPPPHARVISGNKIAIVAPVPYRGTFKITENESPRPTDRVFFNYNFFDNVTRSFSGLPPGSGSADLNRETIGFEKTFAGGNASIGMRLPFLQQTRNELLEDNQVADLSVILKYAFINDPRTRDVLSAGMVLTAPTGKSIQIEGESSLNPFLFQPFLGYIYHFNESLYLQGFSSLVVPTDSRDVTLLFNSFAFGYWLHRDTGREAQLRGVVPQLELHVNTPLNHRGLDAAPIGYPDTVDMTVGSYFLFRRATLGAAVCFPLTGPKPYDVEATVNLNIHF
jgi:hypothetical protein